MDGHDARGDVVRLLSLVERAPEQPMPGGVSDHDLADLQRRLGCPLPTELVEWLRICKGEAIGAGGVFGARPDQDHLDIATYLTLYPRWRELSWLPVAGDGCGNYYVLVGSGPLAGKVAFVDTMSDPDSVEVIAGDSLWTFLQSYLIRG
ncbi:SMI1/KNR4 family protein [Actinoplanes sp. LDG1-06]|uniref:SMI1/KNR4 family protein n=1 Tax=Paractinoplanes ovalisporus TaxID=2810368 RepID=A0ABS2AUB6_9ACTN|nr:SMI1/KNR4 family protein [Actinoplanes ovalisporus]MBM2622806.1 SMI1/KNR4 family protein [Actinoplanes ovalisporus]